MKAVEMFPVVREGLAQIPNNGLERLLSHHSGLTDVHTRVLIES